MMIDFNSIKPLFIEDFRGNIKYDESMKLRTTMRVGGTAPILIEPFDEESLRNAMLALKKLKVPRFLLGGGSNTILPDQIDFAIISTRKLAAQPQLENCGETTTLTLGSGLLWSQACNFCKENGIALFAPFSGLPGTVGGALFMNATCFGFSACDALLTVRYLSLPSMEFCEYKKSAADFSYKKSPFQDGEKIILSADFSVTQEKEKSYSEIKSAYDKYLRERASKNHFAAPSAGSVFKNIPEKSLIAGKIIDECGLKGTGSGGAKIADWHGNFIINEGNATSKDIQDLVNLIKSEVKAKKNIDLECEIIFADQKITA
ncbi:MAG: UDP-N-acetylmuramate dehydrogenase [Treponema sp.]|nr:UDP-N-acetylmuramate dehydrogenase [Treponema sp.]